MSYVRIDMPEFLRYIKLMNKMVDDIIEANDEFARKIEEAGAEWYDDIYKDARNQLFRMQAPTNRFIDQLEELDSDLVLWYCDLYENYAEDKSYDRPVVSMGRTKIIDDQSSQNDGVFRASVTAITTYVNGTRSYTSNIREELDSFRRINNEFADSFHSRRYAEINARLLPVMRDICSLLNEMDALANYVEKKITAIGKHE